MPQYFSHGKLLLSAEYMVLRGAKALAVPTRLGQSLDFEKDRSETLKWESWDQNHQLWFRATFDLSNFNIIATDITTIAEPLAQILKSVRIQKRDFLGEFGGKVKTHLEFDRHWGLGSSSTLISNIAQWTDTDPYRLLKNSFGGSGYDLACATAKGPIIYQSTTKGPRIESCHFHPPFKTNIFFVYLNQKKNSKNAVEQFKKQEISSEKVHQASALTDAIIAAQTIDDFEQIVIEHERFIGAIIGVTPVKQSHFRDFPGAVKSLGAWGGDFVMVTGNESTPAYFKERGYPVVLGYEEMIT